MSFNFRLLKSLRILLFPFSLLYGLIAAIRNYLFDKKVIKSASFNLPIIAVGNLSAGGTGKSPMAEYLLTLLKDKYKLATLSRGYKRKTKGFVLADTHTTALEIGDEPMQFHRKFPDVAVAVGEERLIAIPRLLQERPDIEVIILDDAFQHRSITPGINILLTAYRNLFTRDFFLPAGNLRDQRSSYKRADIIVVTKCPSHLSEDEKDTIKKEIKPVTHQKIFFTAIEYGNLTHLITKEPRTITSDVKILLVCGIADPVPLRDYLSQTAKFCFQLSFSDHHIFTFADIKQIKKKFNDINAVEKMVVTTEKDAVRLMTFNHELVGMPLFVLPVRHRFLFGEGMQFDSIVNTFIENVSGR